MRIRDFIWDRTNLDHIAAHKVASYEVEEACSGDFVVLKSRRGRYTILGQTDSGRYLFVVLEGCGEGVFRAITARDMTRSERRRFQKQTELK